MPARGSTSVTLTARPGSSVRLVLTKRDALALDNTAWFSVPSAADTPTSMTVTLVGNPADRQAARAGAGRRSRSQPGVAHARTYRRQDALGSDLVVLDGFVPADGLPPAPAVALIDPPRIPGGLVGAHAARGDA